MLSYNQSYDGKKNTCQKLWLDLYFDFQGKTIESDLVLRCTGLKPNVSMTKDLFGKFEISKIALWPQFYGLPKNPWKLLLIRVILDDSKFDEKNKLKADDHLQIEGLNGVYAIGDCCNKSGHAGAAAAGDHAKLVASNFVKEIKGKDLQPYKASKLLHLQVNKIPYGRYNNLIYLLSCCHKEWSNRNGNRNQ